MTTDDIPVNSTVGVADELLRRINPFTTGADTGSFAEHRLSPSPDPPP
jgi:hypothetical protein